jgi:rRNA-processing protein FCF1
MPSSRPGYFTGINSLILSLQTGIPYITDCVVGELEKLGQKYRVALKIIKDPRFERITCLHKGTYADDCLVQRVTQVKMVVRPEEW